jgi:hypothetical protein
MVRKQGKLTTSKFTIDFSELILWAFTKLKPMAKTNVIKAFLIIFFGFNCTLKIDAKKHAHIDLG